MPFSKCHSSVPPLVDFLPVFLIVFESHWLFFSQKAFQQRAAPPWRSEAAVPSVSQIGAWFENALSWRRVITAYLTSAVDCAGSAVRPTYWTPAFKAPQFGDNDVEWSSDVEELQVIFQCRSSSGNMVIVNVNAITVYVVHHKVNGSPAANKWDKLISSDPPPIKKQKTDRTPDLTSAAWTNVAPHHPDPADGRDWNGTRPIMKVVQLPAR